MTKFVDFFFDFLHSLKRTKSSTFNHDCLFGFEEALKAYRKFRNLSVSNSQKASLCSLYRFDVVITHTADSFARYYITANCHTESVAVARRIGFIVNEGTLQKKYTRDGTILQDSAWEIKWLLSIAATNLMQRCYKSFKQKVAAFKNDFDRESSVNMPSGNCILFRNVSRDLSICKAHRNGLKI